MYMHTHRVDVHVPHVYTPTCSDFQLEHPLNCAVLVCSNTTVLSCVIQCGLLDLKHARSRLCVEWSCVLKGTKEGEEEEEEEQEMEDEVEEKVEEEVEEMEQVHEEEKVRRR